MELLDVAGQMQHLAVGVNSDTMKQGAPNDVQVFLEVGVIFHLQIHQSMIVI